MPWWFVKVFFARIITKSAIVVHNCNYLLALLLIHGLRTICVCKYLYMLSTTFHDRGGRADDPGLPIRADDPDLTWVDPTMSTQVGKSTHFWEINFFVEKAQFVTSIQNLWKCAVNEEILKNVINIHAWF